MRFPGGRGKALTLSYDDGGEEDIRLIEIMKKHGLKGTFNLNSGIYPPDGQGRIPGHLTRRMSRNECIKIFKDSGMEVAVHGLTHPYLEQLPSNQCTYEVLQDRINLEKDFGVIVRGAAYPFGTYSDDVIASLKQCGIVYARTIVSTERFDLPTDWLRLPATCHHRNPHLMDLAEKFVSMSVKKAPQLFYLWGHSYEFARDDNWNVIEEFAEYMSNREDIWYATNIQIYDYIAAYHQLQFSTDQTIVHNPTGIDLYFEIQGQIFCIKAAETIRLEA